MENQNPIPNNEAQLEKAYNKVSTYLMLQTPPNSSKNPFAAFFMQHLFLNAPDELKQLAYEKAAQDALKFANTIPPIIENQTIQTPLNLDEV